MSKRLENIARTYIARLGLVCVPSCREAVGGKTACFSIRGDTIRIERHAKASSEMIARLRENAAQRIINGLDGFIGINFYDMLSAEEKASIAVKAFRTEVEEITP